MDPVRDQSLRETGKLRACFLYTVSKNTEKFAYMQ